MSSCRKCQHEIPDNAQFCPNCAAPIIEETFICPSCGVENNMQLAACSGCGFSFSTEKTKETKIEVNDIFDTSHMKGLQQEVADKFSIAFEKRLKEEHKRSLHGAYIDRFFKSEFRTSADYRIQQLAEHIQTLAGEKKEIEKERKTILNIAFEELIDFFIIRYCADLNETKLPEAILKYQGLEMGKIDLSRMIHDYLDFENEEESVFFNFVSMPAKKLKNAADSYLMPKKKDKLYFICDLSLLGNCKDGFAMTTEAIFWKMPMEKKQRVFYKKIKEVKRQEDWVAINGIFFNANHSLNLKLIRLLKKLMLMN